MPKISPTVWPIMRQRMAGAGAWFKLKGKPGALVQCGAVMLVVSAGRNLYRAGSVRNLLEEGKCHCSADKLI